MDMKINLEMRMDMDMDMDGYNFWNGYMLGV